MNKMAQPVNDKHYETPEVLDIKPVSIVRVDGDSDTMGDENNPEGGGL